MLKFSFAILAAASLGAVPALASQVLPAAAPAAKKDDKLICKRTAVTGSLVQTNKVCMSASDWRQLRDTAYNFNNNTSGCNIDGGGCRADASMAGMLQTTNGR